MPPKCLEIIREIIAMKFGSCHLSLSECAGFRVDVSLCRASREEDENQDEQDRMNVYESIHGDVFMFHYFF